MSRRTAVLAVGAWLLVVTGCAALVWTVISQAGEDVTASQPPVSTSQDTRPATTPSTTPTLSAAPTATPSGGEPEQPGPVRRTWQGAAGVVVAECTGSAIKLTGASPASGWRYEVDDRGPARVRVEFEAVDEEGEVRVEAVCAGGAPTFSVDTSGKG